MDDKNKYKKLIVLITTMFIRINAFHRLIEVHTTRKKMCRHDSTLAYGII